MKQVFSPFHGRNVHFGRRRSIERPKFSLKHYLTALPTPPTAVDFTAKAAPVLSDIYGNDSLGDCVIAGGYHIVGVETGNATGTPYHATSAQIIKDYSAIGGYVPGNPASDQGCDLLTAINYWMKHGFSNGTKLLGYLAIDATNQQEVELACYLFENLYFGMDLPDKWITPFPSANGFVWDSAGPIDPENGHCVMGGGYGPQGVKIDSWGMLGTLTWAAVKKYGASTASGELYTLLTPDQLAKGQSKAPNGLDWTAILTDFNAMGGNVPVPVPTPPAPTPTGHALTLAQVTTLLQAQWPK